MTKCVICDKEDFVYSEERHLPSCQNYLPAKSPLQAGLFAAREAYFLLLALLESIEEDDSKNDILIAKIMDVAAYSYRALCIFEKILDSNDGHSIPPDNIATLKETPKKALCYNIKKIKS